MSIDSLIQAARATANARGISAEDGLREITLENLAIFSRTHPELIKLIRAFENVADKNGNRMVVATKRDSDGHRTVALAFENSRGVPYGNIRISFNGFPSRGDVDDVITKNVVGNPGARPDLHYIGHAHQAAHACNEVRRGFLETKSDRETALFVAEGIGRNMPTHPFLLPT